MTSSDRRAQSGQTLIVFALVLGVVCGFVALAVDIGIMLHEKRQLQNAADAAALAAAQELPDSPSTAQTVAQQYVTENGVDLSDPDYSMQVTTPYQGDPNKVEVEVFGKVGFLFGRVLGSTIVDVDARAVAEAATTGGGEPPYAIFVGTEDCGNADALLASGSSSTVIGGVHSNSNASVGGSTNTFNGGFGHACNFENGGSGNTFTPAAAPEATEAWPVSYAYSDFPCTYSWSGDTDLSSESEVWQSSNVLKDGVYCSTGKLTLSGSDVSGNVTLVSSFEVNVSGSNFNINGYYEEVLIFSEGSHDSAIDVSGSGGMWTGYIIAPNGGIKMQGSGNLSLAASLMGNTVSLSGSDLTIDSTSLTAVGGSGTTLRLIE